MVDYMYSDADGPLDSFAAPKLSWDSNKLFVYVLSISPKSVLQHEISSWFQITRSKSASDAQFVRARV